jgi:tryptophan synthase alpha chain
MSRLSDKFRSLSRPAFIGFIVAGDPDMETSLRIARTLVRAGTDILELGIPFSDPIADGPVVQRAATRALSAGTTPDSVFSLAEKIRAESDVPIVILTYYNIVYRRGIANFYRDAAESGVDGVIIPDLPVEEADEVREEAGKVGIDQVLLITPSTGRKRQDEILRKGNGFLYLVSVRGVTGVREGISEDAIRLVKDLKGRTSLPLAVGFGISRPEQAGALKDAGADGVIVGSAIVDIVEAHLGDEERICASLDRYVREMVGTLETGQ